MNAAETVPRSSPAEQQEYRATVQQEISRLDFSALLTTQLDLFNTFAQRIENGEQLRPWDHLGPMCWITDEIDARFNPGSLEQSRALAQCKPAYSQAWERIRSKLDQTHEPAKRQQYLDLCGSLLGNGADEQPVYPTTELPKMTTDKGNDVHSRRNNTAAKASPNMARTITNDDQSSSGWRRRLVVATSTAVVAATSLGITANAAAAATQPVLTGKNLRLAGSSHPFTSNLIKGKGEAPTNSSDTANTTETTKATDPTQSTTTQSSTAKSIGDTGTEPTGQSHNDQPSSAVPKAETTSTGNNQTADSGTTINVSSSVNAASPTVTVQPGGNNPSKPASTTPGATVNVQSANSNSSAKTTPSTPGATITIGNTGGNNETNSSPASPINLNTPPKNTTIPITPATPETDGSGTGTSQTITVDAGGNQSSLHTPARGSKTSSGSPIHEGVSSGENGGAATNETITVSTDTPPNASSVPVPISSSPNPNTDPSLTYVMQNGSTTDVIAAKTQALQAQGYTPTPDSEFKDAFTTAINTVGQTANQQKGGNTVDPNLLKAGISLNVQGSQQVVEATDPTQAPKNLTPYQTSLYTQLADPETGLASYPGAENYDPATLHNMIANLAVAASTYTPPAQQQQAIQQTTTAEVAVATPPPPPPQPAPQPKATPHKPETSHGHEPTPPPTLNDRQLAIKAAEAMIKKGGLIGRQGEVAKYFLEHTKWSINGIFGGPVGNGTEESEGMHPERSQATQTDVPASEVLARGLGGGWGYWQSDPPAKVIQWCQAHGLDPNTTEGQGAWLIAEVNAIPVLNEQLEREDISVEQAADIFEQLFERARKPAALNVREADGRAAYKVFKVQLAYAKDQHKAAWQHYKKIKHAWDVEQAKAAEAAKKAAEAARKKKAAQEAAEKQTQLGENILASMKLLDPYGYNNGDGSHGGYRHTDYAKLWKQIDNGEIQPGALILDCSAALNAAVYRATDGKVNFGNDTTFDYKNESHLKQINPTDAKPGDIIVWYFGPGDGHTEVVDHYSDGTWYTFGSHWYYDDVSKDIGPASYTAHGGEYGILSGHATVYRLVE